MNIIVKVFVVFSIGVLGFGCANPFSDNEGEETQGGEGVVNKIEETAETQQETQEREEMPQDGVEITETPVEENKEIPTDELTNAEAPSPVENKEKSEDNKECGMKDNRFGCWEPSQ